MEKDWAVNHHYDVDWFVGRALTLRLQHLETSCDGLACEFSPCVAWSPLWMLGLSR